MSSSPAPHTPPTPGRRNFVAEFASVVIGGLVSVIPLAGAAVFALNPLLRRGKAAGDASDDGFRLITRIDAVPTDGTARMFKVIGTKVDAWTTYPETELGAIYLRQVDGQLECFNARCPHLGCTVSYQAGRQAYVCPCHDSAFSMEGERTNNIPPRGMDPLAAEIRNGNEVWVRFENFRAGQAERIPV
jgi:nitrite reductase/ring-hydroxylating ferredoxin subunit